MSGTYAISQLGERGVQGGFTQEEAVRFAAELGEIFPDQSFSVCDLLPELEQRFPVGAAVWLGQRVHWRRGQRGTVAAGRPESFAKWQPAPGDVPWFISIGGASVFVVLDDGCASWWPVRLLETC